MNLNQALLPFSGGGLKSETDAKSFLDALPERHRFLIIHGGGEGGEEEEEAAAAG